MKILDQNDLQYLGLERCIVLQYKLTAGATSPARYKHYSGLQKSNSKEYIFVNSEMKLESF
jgi:hypothetical protein